MRGLKELIEDDEFYRTDLVGMDYAQTRYLLMYLQEQGKLRAFYARLRDNHDKDATDLQTLRDILGDQNLEAFENGWRKWVLGLRFE